MRPLSLAVAVSMLLFQSPPQQAAPPIQRDPQAIAVLQASIRTMGGGALTDSVAKGSVTITAGSRTEFGTWTLLTRGTTQSSEQIAATYTNQTFIFSNGAAALISSETAQGLSLEAAQSTQSAIFPLPYLLNIVSDADLNSKYLGTEGTNDSVNLVHVQFWHPFLSTPSLQFLASFTVVDLWIDPASNLPRRIAYMRRSAEGDAPTLRIDVFYSDYRNIGGILYPMSVQESLNRTPWAAINIQSVAFNTGLTDSSFPVQ